MTASGSHIEGTQPLAMAVSNNRSSLCILNPAALHSFGLSDFCQCQCHLHLCQDILTFLLLWLQFQCRIVDFMMFHKIPKQLQQDHCGWNTWPEDAQVQRCPTWAAPRPLSPPLSETTSSLCRFRTGHADGARRAGASPSMIGRPLALLLSRVSPA